MTNEERWTVFINELRTYIAYHKFLILEKFPKQLNYNL